MADLFGATQIPAALPTNDGRPVNDVALYYLGSFLQSVANAECGASWTALAGEAFAGTNQGPVRFVFAADPQEVRDGLSIDPSTLPALFLYRDNLKIEQYGNGKWQHLWEVHAVWIVPSVPSDGPVSLDGSIPFGGSADNRHPFWASLMAAWTEALYDGYHPSWIASEDNTPNAKLTGSGLSQFMRYHMLYPEAATRKLIQVEPVEPLPPHEKLPSFEGYDLKIKLSEILERDPTRRAVRLAGLDATISTHQPNPTGQPVLGPAQTEAISITSTD